MTTKASPKYAGVLFDLDGTLLDTADDLGAALNFVLTKHHMPIVPREIFRPVASDGALGLLNLGFGEQLAQYDYEALRSEFLAYYQENMANNTLPYEGVQSLLHELQSHNIPWGIVTNKPIALTQALLPHFPCFMQCEVVVGGDSLAERKPHPLPLLHAANTINIKPEKCIYLGDAERDIESANSAGMLSMIAKWGYIKPQDDITQWQADAMIDEASELLSFIF